MRKRLVLAALVVILVLLLSSCKSVENDNSTIQLWCYDFERVKYYSNALASIVDDAKLFCERNGIPLEIIKYDEKSLSYDDYLLKRNVATANGNMIIIEDVKYMWDIAKQHADYTKLENYDSLLKMYKNKYCIPLGVDYSAAFINNDAIKYYGIDTAKPIITYGDYLQIKQKMKENGARFKLNGKEHDEIINYYLYSNCLMFVNEDSEVLKDENRFKEALKKTISGICDDFKLYNDSILSIVDEDSKNKTSSDFVIYDENSKLTLSDNIRSYNITDYSNFISLNESIKNITLSISPEVYFSPCFYMHKKITNNKIYDLANYIVNEASYQSVTGKNHFYAPVFDTESTRKLLELNDQWEYDGIFKIGAEQGKEKDKKIVQLINDVFGILVRNEETSNLMSNYLYSDRGYSNRIFGFIADLLPELANQNFDYKSDDVNKMIDEKIDEFITNFNIHYK